MLQQGLSVSSGNLAQIWWIIVHYVATSLTSTPRSKWSRWNNLRTNTWGTTYPAFTNLAAIGIIYSIISPFIMVKQAAYARLSAHNANGSRYS